MFSKLPLNYSRSLFSNLLHHLPKNNTISFPISYSFCTQSKAPSSDDTLDELKTYETYLVKHNLSIKKAHQKLRTEEERIIKKHLQNQKYTEIIEFLTNNTQHRLCNLETASHTDKKISKKYNMLSQKDKIYAAYAFTSFRQNRLFNFFKKEVEAEAQKESLENMEIEKLVVYLYGQTIAFKNLDFLSQINSQGLSHPKMIEYLHQLLTFRSCKGPLKPVLSFLVQYLQLLINPSLNKVTQGHSSPQQIRKPSLLQTDIQAFLKVLGYHPKRQLQVNSFKVDFVVQKPSQDGKMKQIAVQVNGSYHYTLQGQIKGRQIIRNMIVNQAMPLKIIHHQDYLLSRGNQNKMAYVQHVLNQDTVNWECKNKGFDSKWQVTETQKIVQIE